MNVIRLVLAGLAGLAPLAFSGAAQAKDAARTEVQFICAGTETFTLEWAGEQALVRFPGRTYRLAPRRSGIGERFSSREATLILDGPFAAFAATDRWRIRKCREAAGRPGRGIEARLEQDAR